MPKGAYLLYEAAAGYSLFEVIEAEEIGAKVPEVEEAINDLKLFAKCPSCTYFILLMAGIIHGSPGTEIPGLVLELGGFCHICWSWYRIGIGVL